MAHDSQIVRAKERHMQHTIFRLIPVYNHMHVSLCMNIVSLSTYCLTRYKSVHKLLLKRGLML